MGDIEQTPLEGEAGEIETPEVAETTEEVEASSKDENEETATSEDDAESGEEKPKRRSRAEERINNLTREKYERDRQIAEMQRQLEAMRMQQPQPGQPTQPETNFPRISDYGYDEDQYQHAVQQWHSSQIQNMQRQQQQMAEQQRQQAEAYREQQLIQEKTQKAIEKYPDFVAKVNDPSLPPLREVNPIAFQTVLESDATGDIAYYLASNPQELYRLASLNPVQTVREITMLEARLKAAPPQQVRTPPKPPSTVADGASDAVKDPNKMTSEQWLEWRNKQLLRSQR